jgi:hypothetical protein
VLSNRVVFLSVAEANLDAVKGMLEQGLRNIELESRSVATCRCTVNTIYVSRLVSSLFALPYV